MHPVSFEIVTNLFYMVNGMILKQQYSYNFDPTNAQKLTKKSHMELFTEVPNASPWSWFHGNTAVNDDVIKNLAEQLVMS